jgi:hypothetical protein
MNKQDILFKSLQTVAFGYSEGNVSVDELIRACEFYKAKTDFDEDYEYELNVAKSLYDSLNGVEQDEEVIKAILPGQTKYVDGVMYIYSPTAPGSKQQYDWHVVKKGSKTNKDIGGGSKLTEGQVKDAQNKINSLFPNDLSTLTDVNTSIGGSTGAKLVQDVAGNRYILKKGSNTNSGHVRSEYLTNQLYSALGLCVPDYELYEENNEAILLSRYIPMAKQPSVKDYSEMAKGFIADVLLANWDVYMNDNCLVDQAGKIYRVDNGGALNYRAQGSQKTFDGDVLKTFNGMVQHNPSIYTTLDKQDIFNQIKDIRAKKSEIVNYLLESGYDTLAKTISERIDNLKDIEDSINNQISIEDVPIVGRNLKSDDEMYREFSDEELKEIFENAQGSTGYRKLMHQGKYGWDLLKTICDKRGFSARPRVVTDDEYWDEISKDNSLLQVHRGMHGDGMGLTREKCVKSLLFDDECFYGTIGAYGEGIYNAGSKYDKSNRKNSWGYQEAWSYAGSGDGMIVHGFIEKDAKVVDYSDIATEIGKIVFSADPKKVQDLQDEIKKYTDEINQINNDINNYDDNIRNEVFKDMNYDESSIVDMTVTIDAINWGALDAFGERDIPSYQDFVEGDISKWVKAQGGDVIKGRGLLRFTLPDCDEVLTISEYQYNGPFSIKRKNQITPAYNSAVERFRTWMNTNKVQKVEDAVNERKKEKSGEINEMMKKKVDLENEVNKKNNDLKNLNTPDPDADIMQAIVGNKFYSEVAGIYAALKGYDVIRQSFGTDRCYYAVLNRSKMVYSNKVDIV